MTRTGLLALLGASLLFGEMETVDGRKIWYDVSGSGEPAIVLVHGWTCDSTFWKAQIPDLSKQHRVITIDLPGHGRSESPRDLTYDMELFGASVAGILRAQDVKKAVLVGHSMGLAVIRVVARSLPGPVIGLVSLDGALFKGSPEEMAQFAESLRSQEARAKMIDTMFVESTPEALRNEIRSRMLATPEWVAVSAMAHLADPPKTAAGPEPDVPMLAIHRESKSIPRIREAYEAAFSRLDFRQVPGVGHFLMMEKPAEINRQILEWISRL